MPYLEDAERKWCPLMKGNCLANDCMAWHFLNEEIGVCLMLEPKYAEDKEMSRERELLDSYTPLQRGHEEEIWKK